MRRFICAGFGQPLGASTLALIKGLGFEGIRQDIPIEANANQLVNEVEAAGLSAIYVLGGHPAQIFDTAKALLASLGVHSTHESAIIEVVNEPDYSPIYRSNPGLWAGTVTHTKALVDISGLPFRVISGGIGNTSRANQDYLRAAIQAGLACDGIGFHSYRTTGTPNTANPGFKTRMEEIDSFLSLVGSRPIYHTEGGWHTAESKIPGGLFGLLSKKVRFNDDQVAWFARQERAIMEHMGCQSMTWFQLNDGPRDGYESHFGLMRTDGSLKPVAGVWA